MNQESGSVLIAARQAQEVWGALSPAERCHRLAPMTDVLSARMREFVEVIHAENGKARFEALGHEVVPAIDYLKWLNKETPRLLADKPITLKTFIHRRARERRLPFGVMLVISPWNLPLFIPLSSVAAALYAGNAVVLKPSEVTPRSARIIEALLEPCALPEGLFQIVEGDGAVGARLIEEGPDKLMFTGSVATGRKVMAACAAHPIPLTLELGGVDAMIVCADADLEYAASAAAWGATFNHGQICASVERILVEEPVRARFEAALIDRLERINVESDLGRITFEGQRGTLEAHLDDARARGLEIPTGGRLLDARRLAPTLVRGEGVMEAAVWREETFGPIVASAPFKDDDEAVALHNATRFGLTASVFSRDTRRANAIADRLRCGLVSINDLGATLYGQPEVPWGGNRQSGFGRSHGSEGLIECTWPRVVEEPRVDKFEPKRPWWYPYDLKQYQAFEALGHALAADSKPKKIKHFAQMGRSLMGMLSRVPRL
ncbi:aldehyde dehydrogenase family protein [Myxococcota bacterium]|nr:aldehyde dehydrogenase family protein [Myxococcota bacterium]MBU1432691.1 aldehyde dehydrogenase family protein [Myxococcota bacterium]MBU1898008.1 aldehyde dehydrogenase family protein [Myxococcota bacterium]